MQKSPRTLKVLIESNQRFFTIKIKDSKVDSLCNSCCQLNDFLTKSQPCPYSRTQESESKNLIQFGVHKCVYHQPNIGFDKPLIGFDSSFNTFRPGKAWSERLHVRDVVGLFDVKKKEVFGKAVVTYVDVGDMKTMLDNHAYNNHVMLDEKGDFQSKLYAVLMKIYGPQIISENKTVTVIGLRRL